MITDNGNTTERFKEFIAYLMLSSWAILGLSVYVPIGITISDNPFILGLWLPLICCVGYVVAAGTIRLVAGLSDIGRIAEFVLGTTVGATALWVSSMPGLYADLLAVPSFWGAIACGALGSVFVMMLATLTGTLTWSKPALLATCKQSTDAR